MEETVRALPDGAVQETSFEEDAPAQNEDEDPARQDQQLRRAVDLEEGSDQTHQASYGSLARHAQPLRDDEDQTQETPSKLTTPVKPTTRAVGPDLLRGLLMTLMALDHNSILNTWPRSAVLDDGGDRDDGVPVHKWNSPVAYAIRLLAHLCAPGFMFLFGMGIVYFGRSRRALGWSASQIARHFVVRAVVLTVITSLLGMVLTLGRLWFMNIVLFALAVDYLLAGMLWLAMARTEEVLAFAVLKVLPDADEDDAREPLLADRRGAEGIAPDRKIMRAADTSWHVHNGLLLALAVVTTWWNIWLSPTGGHCSTHTSALPQSDWSRVWFYVVVGHHFLSLYPPLAWLSFALLGLLYGRIVLARTWTRTTLTVGNALAGVAFLTVFVLTRVLHLGNLSEGCLQMPEHGAHPDHNQYLASWRSFFFLMAYPPEVGFWAYSMGFNMLLLALFGALPAVITSTVLHPLIVYGTSALFFYVTHLLLLGLSWLFWLSIYGLPMGHDPWSGGDERGVDSAWVFWVNWVVVLVLMYPLCRWYGAFKRTKSPESIWRFF